MLSGGTGVICDVGSGGRVVALRSDIDALPLPDLKDVPYRSEAPGVCHACGHDAHTAILLGTAEVLAELAADGGLPGTVRLLFQPAEEDLPGGSLDVIANLGMRDVEQIYALHCDPRIDVGHIGLRAGPITAASDSVEVRLSGPGGHTGRPHLTVELVYALGRVITDLPGLLSRRVDPRAGFSVVWGSVQAGQAGNAIPSSGVVRGTIRLLDRSAWDGAETSSGLWSSRSSCRLVPTRRSTTCAASRPSSTTPSVLSYNALPWLLPSAPTRSPVPTRAWVARTSLGTSTMPREPWLGSACIPPARIGSICTSQRSTSTSGPWRSGCDS